MGSLQEESTTDCKGIFACEGLFSVDRFLGQSLPKAFCLVENALAMQFIEMKVLALRRRASVRISKV